MSVKVDKIHICRELVAVAVVAQPEFLTVIS